MWFTTPVAQGCWHLSVNSKPLLVDDYRGLYYPFLLGIIRDYHNPSRIVITHNLELPIKTTWDWHGLTKFDKCANSWSTWCIICKWQVDHSRSIHSCQLIPRVWRLRRVRRVAECLASLFCHQIWVTFHLLRLVLVIVEDASWSKIVQNPQSHAV